jgi:hypothetical protein
MARLLPSRRVAMRPPPGLLAFLALLALETAYRSSGSELFSEKARRVVAVRSGADKLFCGFTAHMRLLLTGAVGKQPKTPFAPYRNGSLPPQRDQALRVR